MTEKRGGSDVGKAWRVIIIIFFFQCINRFLQVKVLNVSGNIYNDNFEIYVVS